MGPFSYRENLWFRSKLLEEAIPLDELISMPISPGHLRTGAGFRDYLTGGLHPFTLEAPASATLFENMLEKVVATDVVAADPTLSTKELQEMRQMMRFVGRSPVEGMNYPSVSRSLARGVCRARPAAARRFVQVRQEQSQR